jgi:hypothetical protein
MLVEGLPLLSPTKKKTRNTIKNIEKKKFLKFFSPSLTQLFAVEGRRAEQALEQIGLGGLWRHDLWIEELGEHVSEVERALGGRRQVDLLDLAWRAHENGVAIAAECKSSYRSIPVFF